MKTLPTTGKVTDHDKWWTCLSRKKPNTKIYLQLVFMVVEAPNFLLKSTYECTCTKIFTLYIFYFLHGLREKLTRLTQWSDFIIYIFYL